MGQPARASVVVSVLGVGSLVAACGSRTGLGVTPANGGAPSSTVSSQASVTTVASSTRASASVASSTVASTSASSTASSASGVIEPCPLGCAAGTPAFPPYVPLQPADVPPGCTSGFEENNQELTLLWTSIAPGGATGGTLDVEIATYRAPDHIRISGTDATGASYEILDLCDLQTATYSDPTNGCARPPDDSIRQYTVSVTPGTTSILVDTTGACTPHYVRVLGLCQFTTPPPAGGCGVRLIP